MFRRAAVHHLIVVILSVPLALASAAVAEPDPTAGDPFGSFQWPDMRREFLGAAEVVFDPRV